MEHQTSTASQTEHWLYGIYKIYGHWIERKSQFSASHFNLLIDKVILFDLKCHFSRGNWCVQEMRESIYIWINCMWNELWTTTKKCGVLVFVRVCVGVLSRLSVASLYIFCWKIEASRISQTKFFAERQKKRMLEINSDCAFSESEFFYRYLFFLYTLFLSPWWYSFSIGFELEIRWF